MSLEWEIKGDVMFPSPSSPLGVLIRRGRSNTYVGLELVSNGPDVAIAFDGVPVVVFDGTNIIPNIGITVNGGASTFV